jgi:DNA polymerase-3 subunit delta
MEEVIKILNDIKGGNIKPIYFLMGEEVILILYLIILKKCIV